MALIKPQIGTLDPFYRCHLAEAMFDQSDFPPDKRTLPLRRFQRAILALSPYFRFITIYAPNQAGKTTIVSALAAVQAYENPGSSTVILSTTQEQSERLIRDIRNNYIRAHRIPECRLLNQKGGDSANRLELLYNRSSILAVPHSIKAFIGNPANLVILDEAAFWENEDPGDIYAEAVARTGDKQGKIVTISTFNGSSTPDPTNYKGYRGNFFHYLFTKSYPYNPKRDPNAISLKFSYHISPNLTRDIADIQRRMNEIGKGYFEERYMGIPRPQAGYALFQNYFDPTTHVKTDRQCVNALNEDHPLALCFDPGWSGSAAVLMQFDPDSARLIYLRTFFKQKITLGSFIDAVLMHVKREFSAWDILHMIDVAATNTVNKVTGVPDAAELEARIGYSPVATKQPIEPGVLTLKSFMSRTNGFWISDHPSNTILVEAFERAEAITERDMPKEKYVKNGYDDHPLDAARYPAYYLTNGYAAESFARKGQSWTILNSQ